MTEYATVLIPPCILRAGYTHLLDEPIIPVRIGRREFDAVVTSKGRAGGVKQEVEALFNRHQLGLPEKVEVGENPLAPGAFPLKARGEGRMRKRGFN